MAAALHRYCDGTTCGYYRHCQGTSMATSHTSGVAALVISLITTAAKRPCPTPRLFS